MIFTMLATIASLSLVGSPQGLIAENGPDTEVRHQRLAQTYEYETEGDRVKVKYRPRGWFDYFPRRPLSPEYDDLSERERYPETRNSPEQEQYLERRDDAAQERYLEERDDAVQEEYTERENSDIETGQ